MANFNLRLARKFDSKERLIDTSNLKFVPFYKDCPLLLLSVAEVLNGQTAKLLLEVPRAM